MTATTLKEQAMNSATRLASKRITSSRDSTAASGNVAYTGVGFTPTSIQVVAAISSGTAMCVGHVDSSKSGYAVSSASSTLWIPYPAFVLLYPNATGDFQLADISTFDADGFTLAWTKSGSPTGTIALSFLCFR